MTADQPSVALPRTLVLYDGVCGLCNRLVSFLLHRDRHDHFRFAPLQSEFAKGLLQRHGLNPNDLDSVVVLADFRQPTERAFTRSQAVLCAASRLSGFWGLLSGLARLVPVWLREALYRFIARRRYRIFGQLTECPLPCPEDRHKFIR